VGVLMWGYRVMQTVGTRILALTPPMAFMAELAAALNVHLYTLAGIPVSTTHSIIGAIFGIGLVYGRSAVNLRTARDIVLAWAFTPIGAGAVSFVLFFVLKMIVGG